MIKIQNHAKTKLENGELSLGVGLRQSRTVDIGKAMKIAGFDWLFIDMEHNSMDVDVAVQISVAAQDAGITPIVRVPGFEHYHATRALDGGAQGIVVPHVDDAETAQKIASHCFYPPVGRRSMAGAQPQLSFQSYPLDKVAEAINMSTMLIVMAETDTAIKNAEEIAAVEGVDCILIGTNDLCMEMGIPGQFADPRIEDAYKNVVEACKKHGKYAGMGGVYDPALIERYISLGVRLILSGSDFSFMMEAARNQTGKLRGML